MHKGIISMQGALEKAKNKCDKDWVHLLCSAFSSQAKKDNLAEDLNKAFRSLCAPSRLATSFLLGNDLTKVIKDIWDRNATRETLVLANYRSRTFWSRDHPRGRGNKGHARPFSTAKPFQSKGKTDPSSRSRDCANNNIGTVSITPQDTSMFTLYNTPSIFMWKKWPLTGQKCVLDKWRSWRNYPCLKGIYHQCFLPRKEKWIHLLDFESKTVEQSCTIPLFQDGDNKYCHTDDVQRLLHFLCGVKKMPTAAE